MTVYEERREELERYETQMGVERGRLALSLDLLTDALTMVGQHGVYCQSARQPGKPAMDLQIVLKCLNDAKELTIGVMEEIKRARVEARAKAR
ncbi:MAG: hypothetical protein SFV18_15955 [Bryobacteraceae bacterium]|nr:hypothetical protein [Bryobacteraceae bacterium]